MHPIDDRILIKLDKAPEKSKGGVIYADEAKPPAVDGVVVAAGPGERTAEGVILPMRCRVGDKVKLPMYAGHHVKVDGEDFVCVRDFEVLGILDVSQQTLEKGDKVLLDSEGHMRKASGRPSRREGD